MIATCGTASLQQPPSKCWAIRSMLLVNQPYDGYCVSKKQKTPSLLAAWVVGFQQGVGILLRPPQPPHQPPLHLSSILPCTDSFSWRESRQVCAVDDDHHDCCFLSQSTTVETKQDFIRTSSAYELLSLAAAAEYRSRGVTRVARQQI